MTSKNQLNWTIINMGPARQRTQQQTDRLTKKLCPVVVGGLEIEVNQQSFIRVR